MDYSNAPASSEEFDPYEKWLGIRTPPPHDHYSLLGLRRFEADANTIKRAADERMTILRSAQLGTQVALSQRLLNEVARAKICLLNPQKKRNYDEQFRQELEQVRAEPVALPTTHQPIPEIRKRPTHTHLNKLLRSWPLVSGTVAAALIFASAIWLGSGNDAPLSDKQIALHQSDEQIDLPPLKSSTPAPSATPPTATNSKALPPETRRKERPKSSPTITTEIPKELPKVSEQISAESDTKASSPNALLPTLPNPVPPRSSEPSTSPINKGSTGNGAQVAIARVPQPPVTPRPPVNPFHSLPNVFELPPLPGDGSAIEPMPVEVGVVALENADLCVVNVIGGDNASKNATLTFAIENTDPGPAPLYWDVFLRAKDAKKGEGTHIASISLRDKLTFTWTKEAAHEHNSQYLANVKLILSTSLYSHDISLRKPVEGEGIPIVIDGKTQMKTSVKLTSLPDPEKLMVRIWLDAGLPKHQFDLGLSAIDAKDGKTYVVFGERPEDSILRLLVESKLTPTSVDLNVVPYYQFVGQPKPAPYNTKSKKEIQNLPGMRDLAYKTILDSKKRFPDLKKAPPQFTQQLAAMEEEAKKLESAAAQLDRLVATEGAVSKQGNLHFMIYYKADDKEVALYQTAPPPGVAKKK